jgi:nucleoside-diphosphate-sugar epimerase
MEKAVIFGAFEFLGFHFCKKILDEGIEVVGFHHGMDEEYDLIEEKRMEIGRNANFSIEDLDKETLVNEKVTIIIDFYDFFIKEQEEQFFQCKKFEKMTRSINQEESKIIILIPYLIKVKAQYKEQYSKLKDKINLIKNENISVQSVFLPTVYGPWQSEKFLFQQALLSGGKVSQISDREWTGDALYVEDVIKEIMQLIEEDKDSFLLKSGEQDAWEKCAKYLNISFEPIQAESGEYKGEERIIRMSSYEDGLEKQKLLVKTLRLQ